MDEQTWFLHRNGKEVGPLSTDELERLARKGDLQPTDFIWTEEWDDWKPLDKTRFTLLVPLSAQPRPSQPALQASQAIRGKKKKPLWLYLVIGGGVAFGIVVVLLAINSASGSTKEAFYFRVQEYVRLNPSTQSPAMAPETLRKVFGKPHSILTKTRAPNVADETWVYRFSNGTVSFHLTTFKFDDGWRGGIDPSSIQMY